MQPDGSLWRKYLEGKATKEELKELETWFKSMDDGEWIDWIRQDLQTGLASSSGTSMPPGMAMRLREQLEKHAAGKEGQKGPFHGTAAGITPIRKAAAWWMAAASVIILMLAGFLFLERQRHPDTRAFNAVLTWDSITNATAGAKLVTLPDSTRIWLN